MSKKKIFFFSVFSIFFLLLLFEFGSRTLISILTKNHNIFKYGFNKNIDFQIRRLTTLDFEVINNEVFIDKKINSINNLSERKLVWTFGGSTSAISCRKENNTSWPNEMMNENFNVRNYAISGTNSDFALNTLVSSINLGKRPDIILWANYVNEGNVISFGFKNNPELAEKNELELNVNKTLYLIKSFSKSIKNYSVFFYILDRFFVGTIYKLNLDEKFFKRKKLTENDLELAAENYYINTIKAINLSNKLKTKFYIVTLFSKFDLMVKNNQSLKDKIFKKTIQKIVNKNNKVKWINLKEYKFTDNTNINKMFCDNVHFTTVGNLAVAEIINKFLD
tara:strand:- start:153 stop:1160 length:1008 start_codon:yes stop_codon:yes gene_type:complete